MLYYTNEARQGALDEIRRQIDILSALPDYNLTDFCRLVGLLGDIEKVIKKEMKESKE